MDKDGLPVTDLRKEDFALSDNKRQMTISDFERHLPSDLARAVTGQADKEERPSQKRGGGRSIFLFIDYAFNNRFGLKKAKEAALYFIDTRLQPNDRVGIISYSISKSVTLDAELTADHAKIRKIVEDINPNNVNRRGHNVEEDYWVLRGAVPPSSKYLVREYNMLDVKTEREFYKYHASNLFDNMNSLASALLYIKGHKNIIYFSSGVASSTMYDSPISAYHGGNDDREAQRLRKAYETMISNLGSADCSFFIMDTGELGEVIPQRRYLTGAPSLQRLSEGTGGVYFDNPNGYRKIMDDIHTITNSYYVLGYYVHEAWNGNYHEISVTVNRKGLHVYTRRGYFEPKPFSKYSKLEKEIHLMNIALSDQPSKQAPIQLPLKTVTFQEEERSGIELTTQFPLEIIKAISHGKCEIVSMIIDSDDQPVKMTSATVDFSALKQKEFQFSEKFSVPPGKYRCRIIICNLDTGRAAVGASLIEVRVDFQKAIGKKISSSALGQRQPLLFFV